MPNSRSITRQTSEFWTRDDYVGESIWPDYWPDKFA